MKKVLISLWGLLYGIIGGFLGILGIAFMFPESSPGSKEYEEDRFFIPIGVIMLLICLVTAIISYYKLRKSKSDIIIFSAALIIGAAILIFWSLYY